MTDYNYLGLVNDVNRRLNEEPLTSANFAAVQGFYASAKEAVNSAIRAINFQQYEWPFNHVTAEDQLVAGTVRYPYPSDAKTIKFDSFRIQRDNDLNVKSRKLNQLDYEEYLDKFVDSEYNIDNDSVRTVPRHVFRTPDLNYGVYPPPDKDYTLIYEYYRLPVDLILASDVPTIPEQFRHVIVDGAMHHAYLFRSNMDAAMTAKAQFDAGIKQMRSIFINREEYVRSGFIERRSFGVPTLRVG